VEAEGHEPWAEAELEIEGQQEEEQVQKQVQVQVQMRVQLQVQQLMCLAPQSSKQATRNLYLVQPYYTIRSEKY